MKTWTVLAFASMLVGSAALADTHFASTNGANLWPFASMESAATNIQWAVDAAVDGDTVRLADGVYQLSAAITIDSKNIAMESLIGSELTIIDGGYPARSNQCFQIGNVTNCVLRGLTIKGGYASGLGGGGVDVVGKGRIENCVFRDCHGVSFGTTAALSAQGQGGGEIAVSDCTFSNNAAPGSIAILYGCVVDRCVFVTNNANSGASGTPIVKGGYGTELRNCLIYGNSGLAAKEVVGLTLMNCTIFQNHADAGTVGGVSGNFTAYNSIVWSNTYGASHLEGNYYHGIFYYCCTRPQVPDSDGNNNFALDPGFACVASNDFRLRDDSQCLNTGTNQSWMTDATDLINNPRLVYDIVDRGCYESPSGTSTVTAVELGIQTAVEVSWNSQGGVRYWIQESDNIEDTNSWLPVDQRIGNGGEIRALYSTRDQPHRYFKVVGQQ